MFDKILVTSALPYANGPIHFGHIAGAYLPADIFVRFHRLKKSDILYVCGTDEYGVAISIGAEKEGNTPKQHVDKYHKVIKEIFNKFKISFDHFSRTTIPEHTELSQKMFLELYNNGHIETKEIEQHYCVKCSRFLADRFVQGDCYICGGLNARGDECPHCGAWLDSLKLKNPKCKVCGAAPEIKTTRHWFLKLGDFKEKLHKWLDEHPYWKPNVLNVSRSQIDTLESRPITRDIDWGIPVPIPEAKGKVLYVWFDAPIGYVDATIEWAKLNGKPDEWKKYWQNPNCRIINFIGKDNIPFHLLVWPSVLMGQTTKYTLAENIPANEFLNLQGRQFSKSEGWYVDLDTFFERYKSDQIRYFLANNAPEIKDSDFSWKDFQKNNNTDLVGTLGNLVHRIMTFTSKNFDGKIPNGKNLSQGMFDVLNDVKKRKEGLEKLFDEYQVKKACYEIMDIARLGNKYFDEMQPWKKIKEDREECGNVLFTIFSLIEQMAVCAWPVIPETSDAIFNQLGIEKKISDLGWNSASEIKSDGSHKLNEPQILFRKLEDDEIQAEIEKLEKSLAAKEKTMTQNFEPMLPEIDYTDFAKLDLRVAKILEAEEVKKSRKLVKLQVDLGFEKRQILAGIGEFYKPEDLVGKNVVIVANLAPKKLMGELSQGMVLCASLDNSLKITEVNDMPPGAKVK